MPLSSGDQIAVHIPDTGLTFTDTYWSNKDYQQLFFKAGLSLLYHHAPRGNTNDGISWLDERYISPVSIYVLKKPQTIKAQRSQYNA